MSPAHSCWGVRPGWCFSHTLWGMMGIFTCWRTSGSGSGTEQRRRRRWRWNINVKLGRQRKVCLSIGSNSTFKCFILSSCIQIYSSPLFPMLPQPVSQHSEDDVKTWSTQGRLTGWTNCEKFILPCSFTRAMSLMKPLSTAWYLEWVTTMYTPMRWTFSSWSWFVPNQATDIGK